jgi:hypothetical protein
MRIACLTTLLFISFTLEAQLIPYHQHDRWGVVDRNRVTIVPLAYDEITICGPRHARYILAAKDRTLTIFDSTGKKIRMLEGSVDTVQRSASNQDLCGVLNFITVNAGPAIVVQYPTTSELIRYNGDVLIAAGIYDHIRPAGNAMEVKKNGRYGILDSTLRLVVPVEYKNISYSRYWMLLKKPGARPQFISRLTWKKSSCDIAADHLYSHQASLQYFRRGGKLGLKDSACNILIPAKYKGIIIEPDLLFAQLPGKNYHIYRRDGSLLLNEEVSRYEGGPNYIFYLADRTLVYNKRLELVLQTEYTQLSPVGAPQYHGHFWQFHERPAEPKDLYFAKRGSKWGIIDITGKLVFPLLEARFLAVFDDYAVFVPTGKDHSLRDLSKREKDTIMLVYRDGSIRPIYVDGAAYGLPVDNRLAVLKNGQVSFINFNGEQVISPVFDRDLSIATYMGMVDRTYSFIKGAGTAEVIYKGRRVMIDTSGNIVDSALLHTGFSRALKNGWVIAEILPEPVHHGHHLMTRQYALMNQAKQVLLEGEMIHAFDEKYILVQREGKYALFDMQLKQLTQFKYEFIHHKPELDLFFVKRDGRTGYMDTAMVEYFE